MLDLRSKLRRKLFLYFFTNPQKKLFLREIARILKVDPTNLSKELARLTKDGLFNVEEKGNQKYFFLNISHPLYKEIKKIIFKTIGIEGKLKDIIEKTPGIEVAFIYGSFAKGSEEAMSDIDLILIGRFNEDELIEKISNLEGDIGREINYHYYTRKEWSDYKEKRDSFINNVVNNPKIFLKGRKNDL